LELPIFWQQEYVDLVENSSKFRLIFDGIQWQPSSAYSGLSLITFTSAKDILYSPAQATYGGILKVGSNSLQDSTILTSLMDHFVREGVHEFHISLAPEHLSIESLIPPEIYLNHGFSVKFENTSHFINMSTWTRNALSKGNRKKSNQATQLGLIFEETPEVTREECYRLIEANRLSLGAKVSVSLSKLETLISTFPHKYFLYHLRSPFSGKIAASVVLVETSSQNLYTYLWADSMEFRGVSPIVSLLEGIIDRFADKYTYLDLGTSAIEGVELEGLARFKDNLGATRSSKKTIVWVNPNM
jgi:hypothetical protein